MDLGLSEIQQMLKNSAQEFFSQECPLTLVRELEEDPRGYTEELWRQMVGLGWTGLAFPEEYGGTGGSFLDLAATSKESSPRGTFCVPSCRTQTRSSAREVPWRTPFDASSKTAGTSPTSQSNG